MAAISIKNASLTAAHARAEADAASFAEREEADRAKTVIKKKEERRDRQQMMGEREKNRARKLKALGGREWDLEKNEEDFQRGGKFDGKGFGRDQEGWTDGREYLLRDAPSERGRGRGGGRGRGRGGRADEGGRPPRQEDFPALPPAALKEATAAAMEEMPAAGEGGSWADQVESSTTA